MSKVEWIKVNTGIFDDQKIKLIEAMPEADALLVIWLKLLVLAGQVNDSGFIYLTQSMPYTDEMLAQIFNRKITVIRLALSTFQQLEMIEVSDAGLIGISNWSKHQNVEGLDKIREQNKKRQQKHRDKQKNAMLSKELDTDKTRLDKNRIRIEGNVTDNVTDIISFFNEVTGKKLSSKAKSHKEKIEARLKDGFTVEDVQDVIVLKNSEWKDEPKMSKHIVPKTLFRRENFENYMIEVERRRENEIAMNDIQINKQKTQNDEWENDY